MTVEYAASGPVAWIDEAGIVWVSIEHTVRFACLSDTTHPPAGWTELVRKPVPPPCDHSLLSGWGSSDGKGRAACDGCGKVMWDTTGATPL